MLCFLPVVLAIAWQRRSLITGLTLAALLAVPVLLAAESYKSFNETRFGERFVTTGGRTVMLFVTIQAARHEPAIFDGGTPLDRTARGLLKAHDFADTLRLNQELLDTGLSEQEISRAAFAKFFDAWRRFPLVMAREVAARLRFDRQAVQLFNPPQCAYINARWRGWVRPAVSKWLRTAIRNRDPAGIAITAPIMAARLPSAALYITGLLGALLAAFFAWRREERSAALGLIALVSSYAAYMGVYALVNMEMRYLAGIAAAPLIAAALTLARMRGTPAARSV
ncbi:MAG: hypothetical protein Kow0032_17330 [Methyloligellaceae bacterium]